MDWAGVGVRFALYLDLTLAFGLTAFAIGNRRAAHELPIRPLIAVLGTLGLLLSACGLLVLTAAMLGVPVTEVDRDTLTMVLSSTAVGMAWITRMAALAAAIAAALLIGRVRGSLMACAGALAVSVATLAWAGHGAMNEGTAGWLHLIADIAHLLAAAVWIGTLLALVLFVARPERSVDRAHLEATHAALHGFSATGSFVVAVIVLTGLANIWLVVGPSAISRIPGTLYGQLLLAKLALFAAMLALAAVNRFRLTPALSAALSAGDHRRAFGALRASIATETAFAVAIFALVAWLGTLEPSGA